MHAPIKTLLTHSPMGEIMATNERECDYFPGGTVDQWVALFPHNKKVPGLSPG